ncbi:hypothetical protein BST43_25980 [Mycobacteroides saopaulense]|uniref:Uncharacterized protein n=1 Tax=Mycobacteroides saopaulense TaxID=1578165 RepID=A0A1X0IIH2_9MYCO|nr:hypothetical protein BST43_25980 [Mycobacteroides saopaulense]
MTFPSQIVDLANPSKIIGASPVAQSRGAYDPVSNTMLVAGNVTANLRDSTRALYQSAPIDPANPNGWINTLKFVGNILPGDRESQLIALGSEGKDGFLFVGSSSDGFVQGVIASTPQELTQKLGGQLLLQNTPDGVYGPTIFSQAINSANGTGNLGLRVSQYWDPAVPANPDGSHIYAPRIYEANCTVQ